MKKSLLGLLLAIALVLPATVVFADEETNLELVPKVGYLFTPEVTSKGDSISNESTFSLGADLFFDMENNLFLGCGLVWGNTHKIGTNDNKMGFMDIYAALKYKFLMNANEEAPIYLYPLVNLGIGVPSWEVSTFNVSNYELTPSFYWGLGAGVEICNIIVEAIYGCNYSTQKYDSSTGSHSENFTYTAFRINVGYRFEL